MRVGIDGGVLSITDDRLKVGVYRVAYNLVKELAALNAKNDYRVYSFSGGEQGRPIPENDHLRYVKLPRLGFRTLWQSYEMLTHWVDAYLGVAQTIPQILYDVNKIGFIYDLAFLTHPALYPRSQVSLMRHTAQLVKRSDHIVTISRATASQITQTYQIPAARVSVAYLGVDPVFTPEGDKFTASRPYFLFAGAFKPGKNIPMMLTAFAAYLQKTAVEHDFYLVGSDYWMDPQIEKTITELHLEPYVKRVGFVSDAELASYMRGAKALLSVSKVEGFGLPAVEAMACGTPVVVSNSAVQSEIVGQAGFLVSSEDTQGLVDILSRLTTDETMRTRVAQLGLARSKQFRWDAFARQVAGLL